MIFPVADHHAALLDDDVVRPHVEDHADPPVLLKHTHRERDRDTERERESERERGSAVRTHR